VHGDSKIFTSLYLSEQHLSFSAIHSLAPSLLSLSAPPSLRSGGTLDGVMRWIPVEQAPASSGESRGMMICSKSPIPNLIVQETQ